MPTRIPYRPANPVLFVSQQVTDYIQQNKCQGMLDDFNRVAASKKNNSPITFLADCVCNLKRHQWHMKFPRYKNVPINAATELIKGKIDSRLYRDFEELSDAVRKSIKDIYGVGDCVIYDCSLRLGSTMNLFPDEYVYIHALPREVLLALIKGITPVVANTKTIRVERKTLVNIFPSLSQLSSACIENLLCLMHDKMMRPTNISASPIHVSTQKPNKKP